MKFCSGRNPESYELTDDLVHKWGKIIGKSHKVTKKFSVGESNRDIGYKDELLFFMNWCKDPIVKSAWAKMEGYLDALPKGQNEYVFTFA